MNTTEIRNKIDAGETSLGIELGSTRIKAILLDDSFEVISVGETSWENELSSEGFWTYSEEDIWSNLQKAYQNLVSNIQEEFDVTPVKYGAIGFSAMMHGYIALDNKGELLVPFRTWRNGNTDQATKVLSGLFDFNIPHRWSIAHLYQAILNKEEHVDDISQITTLAGYIHWKLTGKRVLGVGDASGMFPVDSETANYNKNMIKLFDGLVKEKEFSWAISDILPEILLAGEEAGQLTAEGVKLLDSTGKLQSGIKLAPPEGDAGTGMVATNSVKKGTANVSAGTSAFSMVVLESALEGVYPEIDIVTTPDGVDVAMVHINNCTSEINYWMSLIKESFNVMGVDVDMDDLYNKIFTHSLESDSDVGQLLVYGFHSGENIVNVEEGRPMIVRNPSGQFNLANFVKANLYSAFATLKIGMDILIDKEKIDISNTIAHGGIFKTPKIAQSILASVMKSSVTVLDTASEGGAWGMAVLASYLNYSKDYDLATFLDTEVFKDTPSVTVDTSEKDIELYEDYIERFTNAIELERNAADFL